VMGARTRADSFCLATIVDRLVIVLPVFALLGATGTVDPHIAYLLVVMDTVLALVTLGVWWKTRSRV
jgi:Na+-driven multidrug efflux pump